MDKEVIYCELNEIFQSVFMRDDLVVTEDSTANTVAGWDSVKFIEILMVVESKYGFRFQTKEMDSLSNVGDLVAVISKHVGSAS